MGVVYKAEDTKLKRTVALKFLPFHTMASEEEKARFEHEAQAAAALDHSNICTVHEINEADGQTFIAMAFVEGQSLDRIIRRGEVTSPLPVDQALNYGTQIAEGLQAAHEKGIVHRDIKPGNILLTEKGLVKITDFGLAKSAGRTQLTKEGTSLGTAAYMSPEQAQGVGVDHRADIWALGAVIYEMITGQQPFIGDYEPAVIYLIMNEDPEPPTSLRSGVPMDLERIVLKSLAKEPAERYQNVQDVLVDLKAVQKQLEQPRSKSSVRSPHSGPSQAKASGHSRRSRSPVVAGVTLLILLSALLIWKFMPTAADAPALQSIAVLPFTDLSPDKDQEYFCDGMTEEILTRLSKLPELKVIARTSVMRYKNTDKGIAEIGQELDVATILEGSIRKEQDNIRVTAQLIQAEDESHLWAQTYDKKLASVFALQDEVSRAIAQALKFQLTPERISTLTTTAEPKNTQTYEHYLKGKHQLNSYFVSRQEGDYQAALDWFDKALAVDSTYGLAYTGRSWTYHSKWVFTGFRSQELLDLKFKNAEMAVKWDPNSAEAQTSLAAAYNTYRNPEKTSHHLKIALQLNPNLAEANYIAAHFWGSILGVYNQGLKYFARTIELDPYFFPPYIVSAQYLIDLGKYEEADLRLKEARKADPNFVDYGVLALLAIFRNEFDRADSLIEKAAAVDSRFREWERALLFAAKGEREKALALSKGFEIYALSGMEEKMFEELRKQHEQTASLYSHLANSPLYDRYRDSRHFVEIVDREKQKEEAYLQKYQDLIFGSRH